MLASDLIPLAAAVAIALAVGKFVISRAHFPKGFLGVLSRYQMAWMVTVLVGASAWAFLAWIASLIPTH